MPNISSFKNHNDYLNWYRKYRNENREKMRLNSKKYNRIWRKKNKRNNTYPEKQAARIILNSNIRKGNIKRLPCKVCGNIKSQGHHEDYSKPLKVIWLCALHHAQKHTG